MGISHPFGITFLFGKDVFMMPQRPDSGNAVVQGSGVQDTQGWFKTKVKVAVSSHFLSWVIALGEGVKIVGPDWVVDEMKKEIKRLQRQYSLEE